MFPVDITIYINEFYQPQLHGPRNLLSSKIKRILDQFKVFNSNIFIDSVENGMNLNWTPTSFNSTLLPSTTTPAPTRALASSSSQRGLIIESPFPLVSNKNVSNRVTSSVNGHLPTSASTSINKAIAVPSLSSQPITATTITPVPPNLTNISMKDYVSEDVRQWLSSMSSPTSPLSTQLSVPESLLDSDSFISPKRSYTDVAIAGERQNYFAINPSYSSDSSIAPPSVSDTLYKR